MKDYPVEPLNKDHEKILDHLRTVHLSGANEDAIEADRLEAEQNRLVMFGSGTIVVGVLAKIESIKALDLSNMQQLYLQGAFILSCLSLVFTWLHFDLGIRRRRHRVWRRYRIMAKGQNFYLRKISGQSVPDAVFDRAKVLAFRRSAKFDRALGILKWISAVFFILSVFALVGLLLSIVS